MYQIMEFYMRKKQLIIIGIIMLICIGLSGCTQTDLVHSNDPYEKSKQYVLDSLKAPATAQFPAKNKIYCEKKNENTWVVVAYVDAQNSYGALIRQYYGCELVENAGTWACITLNIGETDSEILYKWIYVTSISGSDSKNSSSFNIIGDRWRIDWSVGGRQSYDYGFSDIFYFTIWSYDDKNDSPIDYVNTQTPYDSGTKDITDFSGEYYGQGIYSLHMSSINVGTWSVEVYQGISIM
jgi:hypothetical protein